MRQIHWLVLLAALAMVLSSCEKEKGPQVAPSEKPAAEEKKAMTPEEKTSLPVVNEKIEKEAAQPAVPPPSPEPAQSTGVPEKAAGTPEKATGAPEMASQPPTTVTYEASFGQVTFDHEGHAGRLACDSCHTTDPPVRIAIDKEKAHQMCKGCHQEKGAGPTQCNGCHKKG